MGGGSTSCITGGIGFGTDKVRCRLIDRGVNEMGYPVPNEFSICGSLYTTDVTLALNVRFRRILNTVSGSANIGNEVRIIPAGASCAIVVSCTRSPSNLRGVVASLHRVTGNEIMAIFNYNKSESGAGQPGVNGVTTRLSSFYIMASSGPHSRGPTTVVSSVLRNVGNISAPCGIIRGEGRTVG